MTFHGQSVLSCVWGVTHPSATPVSTTPPVEMKHRSAPRLPVRLTVLSRVVRKLRPMGPSGGAGSSNQR